MEKLMNMVEDRFRLKTKLQEIEWQIIEEIIETKRMEFVSVNWRRLHQQFIKGEKP